MAYYGSSSPIIPPHSMTPVPRAVTPSIPGPPGGQIQPGSLTYTTTQGPDGQLTYHLFKATSASYQTPQGIVTGIQWIPAEATAILPAGATPATADILASFQRPGDERFRDWQRDEDRRRREIEKELRREDKERRRQEREEERELEREIRRARDRDDRDRLRRDDKRRSSGYGYERDLDRTFRDMELKDRERDREYDRDRTRSHRGSMYGGEPPSTYPTAPGGYPAAPAPAGYAPSSPYATTAPQPYPAGGQGYPVAGQPYPTASGYGGQPVAPRPVSPYQAAPIAPRPVSPYAAPGVIPGARAASPYAAPPRAASPYAPPPRAPSPYGQPRAASPYAAAPPMRSASPYQAGAVVPPPPSRSPYQAPSAMPGVYPPGHIMEGRTVGRAPSPSPYGGATPGGYGATTPGGYGATTPGGYGATTPGGYGAQPGYPTASSGYATPGYQVAGQAPGAVAYPPPPGAEAAPMPAPEGFSRPPNLAQSYTRFETLKIQDMDDFFENIPRMPLVLVPHDVYHEDWIRLMTDLSLAWSGKLPVPDYARDGRVPKRTTLTADLIDLWNTSFFLKRGVEVVLFKGRERRSGRGAGTVELHLPGFDDLASYSDDSEDEDDSSEDDSDLEDRYRYGGGAYGRGVEAQLAELQEAKRLRKERKRAEKRRRKQEKKQRRKQKEAERKYALYITCVPIEP